MDGNEEQGRKQTEGHCRELLFKPWLLARQGHQDQKKSFQ
jgi:hypothetical protein